MNWHEYFTYDESTGNLIWKSRTPRNGVAFNSRCAGKVAGCKSTAKKRVGARGPVMVLVNYHHTTAHRIIWEMHYGPVPEGLTIDHIDRDPHNNRLSNLRLATYEENNRNRGSFRHNKSGVKGVFWEKDRSLWKAVIYKSGKLILIGRFRDIEEARMARETAEIKYFGEYRAA